MKQINMLLMTFFLVISVTFLSSCNKKDHAKTQNQFSEVTEKFTSVAISELVLQDLWETFILPGILEASDNITLAAEMNGPIRWIGLKEGDLVKKNEVFLHIDSELYKEELNLDRVQYELQKKRMERFRSLFNCKLVSQQEFEDACRTFEQAKAKLRISQILLDKSMLNSPVEGILDKIMVDFGEYVNEGTPVAIVMQVDFLKAIINIPEKDIVNLKVGEKVKVFLTPVKENSKPGFIGEIIYLSYQADPATRTYQAKILLDNNEKVLRPGMIVKAVFTRQQLNQVIAVPLHSLVEREGVKVVYVEQNGKAHKRPIKMGPVINDLVVIEEGLISGENLITKGQHLINDGSSVIVEGSS